MPNPRIGSFVRILPTKEEGELIYKKTLRDGRVICGVQFTEKDKNGDPGAEAWMWDLQVIPRPKKAARAVKGAR